VITIKISASCNCSIGKLQLFDKFSKKRHITNLRTKDFVRSTAQISVYQIRKLLLQLAEFGLHAWWPNCH